MQGSDIDKFLSALRKSFFRKPGRLYLADGAAIVHYEVLRSGSTMDIDITIETVQATDEDEMVMAIRRIVEQMQVNVVFASRAILFRFLRNGWHRQNLWDAMEK